MWPHRVRVKGQAGLGLRLGLGVRLGLGLGMVVGLGMGLDLCSGWARGEGWGLPLSQAAFRGSVAYSHRSSSLPSLTLAHPSSPSP